MAREGARAGRQRLLLVLGLGVVACAAGLAGLARAQVFYEREQVEAARKMLAEGTSPEALAGQKTSENDGWLRKMQVQFPEADLNGDGILTEAEGTIWHQQQVHAFPPQGHELDNLPEGVSHWTVMVPMRDGVELATEIYLPEGGGPWPAILTRTNRGRMDSALDYGDALLESGDYAFIGQDPYPAGGGGGGGGGRFGARRNAITDGYDTVEWIAAQPWCDGNVAVFGYSEAGMTSKSALLSQSAAPEGAGDLHHRRLPRPLAGRWRARQPQGRRRLRRARRGPPRRLDSAGPDDRTLQEPLRGRRRGHRHTDQRDGRLV